MLGVKNWSKYNEKLEFFEWLSIYLRDKVWLMLDNGDNRNWNCLKFEGTDLFESKKDFLKFCNFLSF